ncbi:MAG TPA: hypothetical protein VFQ45_04120 [Longimicrobium sp.]|nr:hypothetical protein [Longimicrobium sp.]
MTQHYELGPDPRDPAVRRKNLRTLAGLVAAVAVIALVPATCRRVRQPAALYPTYEEARRAPLAPRATLPALVPATATQIHVRYNRDTGRRFVRFTYPERGMDAATAGLRRLPHAQVERLTVPTPGWSNWWLISSRTLRGSQGEHLHVFQVPDGPDRGWLALDPRTRHAYYWSERPAGAGGR